MEINGKRIGHHTTPYIVAEMGANHNGEKITAFKLIAAAKFAGAHAIKVQCYLPESICAPYVMTTGPWKGYELRELYKEAHIPRPWFKYLFALAKDHGIPMFSSVFSRADVDFIETFDPPAYKISSFDITDLQLIRYVVDTGKPIILSTGMASDQEIMDADDAIPPQYPHMFLHCVSGYPTPVEEARLGRIRDINRIVQLPVNCGLSDHSVGHDVAVAAVALGAPLIEKHLTLDRAAGGPDSEFSMEPDEFAQMAHAVWSIYHALYAVGEPASEKPSLLLRKSLFASRDISAGELLSETSVVALRPAIGVPAGSLDAVCGRVLRQPVKRGNPVLWEHLE